MGGWGCPKPSFKLLNEQQQNQSDSKKNMPKIMISVAENVSSAPARRLLRRTVHTPPEGGLPGPRSLSHSPRGQSVTPGGGGCGCLSRGMALPKKKKAGPVQVGTHFSPKPPKQEHTLLNKNTHMFLFGRVKIRTRSPLGLRDGKEKLRQNMQKVHVEEGKTTRTRRNHKNLQIRVRTCKPQEHANLKNTHMFLSGGGG